MNEAQKNVFVIIIGAVEHHIFFLKKTYLSLTFNLSAFLPNQIPHGRKAAAQEGACGAIGVYPHSNHLFILMRQLPVTTHQVDKKRETSC